MWHLLSLSEWTRDDLEEVFHRAGRYAAGRGDPVNGAAVLFFPPTSIRTRVSFERGAAEMGLQSITFPPETLDKTEDLADVVGYLAEWADVLVVRHPELAVLQRMASVSAVPVINGMTDTNHPCEVLSDLYALSQNADVFALRYLIVAPDGNIARTWQEASHAFGLDVRQCCPDHLRVQGMAGSDDLTSAITSADVVITDGPGVHADALSRYRVTADLLDTAPDGVRFAPCPPFLRGREVSADAIAHHAFVGYGFKRSLKPVQQAVMARALGRS